MSSFVFEFSSIGNGGVCDSESTRSSLGITSISPVAILSFTAPERLSTFPTTATTYSARKDAAFSMIAASVVPSSHTTCIIPERSLTSVNTSPPLFLFFCTHPMIVTVSPTLAAESSPQRCVLLSPCIDSAMVIYFLSLFSISYQQNLCSTL